jgi:hypothetical protein
MLLECGTSSYRPFGLSGRLMPRLGGEKRCIPFLSMVPAHAPGLAISQIRRVFGLATSALQRFGAKGDPLWV